MAFVAHSQCNGIHRRRSLAENCVGAGDRPEFADATGLADRNKRRLAGIGVELRRNVPDAADSGLGQFGAAKGTEFRPGGMLETVKYAPST